MADPRAPSSHAAIKVWAAAFFVYACLTLCFLGDRPLARAQEARVLETARQMLESPSWHGWLVPHLNGEPRLRKPPLCYWYTAASFEALDVNKFSGRLPSLMIGFAAIVITGLLGRELLGPRGGWFAAAVLAGSYFFVRFARSAETDIPCVLGTALGCYGVLRASRGSLLWMHLAALGIAINAMSKGGPAIYPLVFLGLYALASRSWRPVVRFVLSGAPLTAGLLVVPWFVYVFRDPAAAQVAQEIKVVTTGANHFGLFYEYLPILLMAILPWTGLYFAGLLAKEFRSPLDVPNRVILCVIGCVAIPLCVTLNVQPHYLLPMLPGCALLTAWLLDRLSDEYARPLTKETLRVVRWVFGLTAALCLMLGPFVLMIGYAVRRQVGWREIAGTAILIAAGLLVFVVLRRRSTYVQLTGWAIATMIFMPIVAGWWAPTLDVDPSYRLAHQINARFPGRPLASLGADVDISLNFAMRRATPSLKDEAAVRTFMTQHPDGVILRASDQDEPLLLPDVLKLAFSTYEQEARIECYEAAD